MKLISVGTCSNKTQFDGFYPLWLGMSLSFFQFQNMGNKDIVYTPKPYRNPPQSRKSFYYPFYINRNQNRRSFYSHNQESQSFWWHSLIIVLSSPSISHTLSLSLLYHHSHCSPSSLCWIIHYNIVFRTEKYFYFFY